MNADNIILHLMTLSRKRRITRVTIVTHKHADPDAVGSAIGLGYMLKALFNSPELTILSPEDCASLTLQLVERFGVEERYDLICGGCDSGSSDLTVVVDTANESQLGNCIRYIRESQNCIVIDHHSTGTLADKCIVWRDSTYTSASEMVVKLYETLELTGTYVIVPKEIEALLVAGILYDTKRLQRISPYTLKLLSRIADIEELYKLVSGVMRVPSPLSERIAVLKGMQRMIIKEINNVLIAGTHVGSYESQVARNMLIAGADIALVLSVKKDFYRIAIRTRKPFDAGLIASGLAIQLGGSGGGHAESALVEVSGKPPVRKEKMVSKIIQLIITYLERDTDGKEN
ncbi:MAG: DHH family phosphoesterase [Desulfurococcales archaeon]|nr:DHH family phosphoesterase [Desulfurococcales archaeon]